MANFAFRLAQLISRTLASGFNISAASRCAILSEATIQYVFWEMRSQ